jgi:hypothetical protein
MRAAGRQPISRSSKAGLCVPEEFNSFIAACHIQDFHFLIIVETGDEAVIPRGQLGKEPRVTGSELNSDLKTGTKSGGRPDKLIRSSRVIRGTRQ